MDDQTRFTRLSIRDLFALTTGWAVGISFMNWLAIPNPDRIYYPWPQGMGRVEWVLITAIVCCAIAGPIVLAARCIVARSWFRPTFGELLWLGPMISFSIAGPGIHLQAAAPDVPTPLLVVLAIFLQLVMTIIAIPRLIDSLTPPRATRRWSDLAGSLSCVAVGLLLIRIIISL